MAELPKQPIIEPLQQRSRDTANKVLDALDMLLQQKPLDAIAMQELAQQAGASISSIYARFRDKQALVLALHERVVVQLTTRLMEQAQQDYARQPLPQLVRWIMSDFLQFARRNEHVYRAVLLSGDPLIHQRVVDQIQLASRLCIGYLQGRMPDFTDAVALRVDMAVRVVVATMQQTWVIQRRSPSLYELDDDALVEQLACMVMPYLALPDNLAETE